MRLHVRLDFSVHSPDLGKQVAKQLEKEKNGVKEKQVIRSDKHLADSTEQP